VFKGWQRQKAEQTSPACPLPLPWGQEKNQKPLMREQQVATKNIKTKIQE